ncbi:Pkinase-domain-containing protein [Fomitiporia mediterranea MF3/22]|uniref:Pkinase-domain-containing protein n=1 Tax=Fomitiporia mediterranea (strain MF3/22) TaxID=694068 RepID=UPI00044077B8|nr:Pkinase-domain-containing protein [Fomitiporia mediterranea MF3/22]EJD01207.1 Pkinase-domain-containing protein [Fomitiporia mediterranea MF3/22]
MPTTGVMIDAFRNLIRHGKQHHEPSRSAQDAQTREKAASSSQAQRTRERDQRALAHDQQQLNANQQRAGANQPMVSPNYRREAELIVQEENEAKSKMPTYKGLEKYKLLEKMGDGAFSNVYKAIDLTTGQKVAVKVVRKYELNASQDGNKHLNPQFKKRPRVTEVLSITLYVLPSFSLPLSICPFALLGYCRANILKEVQIMRGINHPGIVQLLHFFESDEHYFLILELMEGGELFHQIVKLTYFSENLSRHVILQVASAIRYLHEERGVVHRDIKPENLLFERIPIIPSKNPIHRPYDEEKEDEGEFIASRGGGGIGRVKLADFGLSKVVWDQQTMTPCGTVGYTAPEIVKDERYSKSVDMWALGCVLYTLLCGFPPFYDESINVLTEKVARGYYTFLSPWWDDISASAKDLITHLLCVDPAQRYTIDQFLAHPWCNEAPAPPPPPTPMTAPAHAIDSPLLQALRGGREARSPGLATLKEAFDVTYAVHRAKEEEEARRAYHGPGGAGMRGFLHDLNEDDEDMEQDKQTIEDARQREKASQQSGGSAKRRSVGRDTLNEGRAGMRDAPRHRGQDGANKPFVLDIDNATLLGRRHRRVRTPGVSSPLAQQSITGKYDNAYYETPGSPMQIG